MLAMSDRLIFAVDPGTTESAYVVMDGSQIAMFGKDPNEVLIHHIRDWPEPSTLFVIEMVQLYGMAGKSTADTLYWIGRFCEAASRTFSKNTRLFRREVLKAILGKGAVKGGDKFIREAMIAKYGPQGTKKAPGPTYGIANDMWSALAIATTYQGMLKSQS